MKRQLPVGTVLNLRAYFRNKSLTHTYAGDEPPLRAELFSSAQMEQHGRTLAGSHQLSLGHAPDRLLMRLTENDAVLQDACRLLATAVKANRRIVPAGEWLLDNFYLIEEQIRTAKRHLPKSYSRELPRLAHGPSAGLPRVYDLALETIAHGDGRVDLESLSRFVAAYQQVSALTLGELWAIPIMLRLALIENLRRVSARVAAARIDRNLADSWADQMMDMTERDPKNLVLVIADMARSKLPQSSAFVAEMARRLRGQSPALAAPLTWIEHWLSESGLTIEHLVQLESQHQAADQVSISNSIGSLRFLAAMDWREFVETMSVVEQTLRQDPGGVYGRMDFATRDRYRHAVEKIAKRCPLSEGEVAHQALQLARAGAAANPGADRTAHVGFYLIDAGLLQLERRAQARLSLTTTLLRSRGFTLFAYLGAIALLTALFSGSLIRLAYAAELPGWLLALLGVALLLATSQLAVALVNWLATLLVTPQPLPRLDFSQGIPPEARTLVAVPSLLTSAAGVEDLVDALEIRFLANRDDNLHFGLLTDFRDAAQATCPEDDALVGLARQRIDALNQRYRRAGSDPFFLFHRPRRWNPHERLWMGYERKRGKLGDLNALLRGGGEDRFSVIVGRTEVLTNVKYVITLDTDTQLPREAAWQCVGALAHPLNRARYDQGKGRVVEGYGILQPRLAVSLPGANQSWYARLYSSEAGIDPYTRAVSDVYQDLFQEGSFIGKGIYEVDAFERALDRCFPENRILSHDLLEGCYARSGLLSDVQLYEDYPARYSADVSRRHRWIRGDWLVARWLLPRVPDLDGHLQPNPLSALSRWKIFDNLRRSLTPPAVLALVVLGWTVLPAAWLWTVAVVAILLLPAVLAALAALVRKPEEMRLSLHLIVTARSLGRPLGQAAFTLACLPYEALFSLDAIGRTIWRLRVSHRRILEWRPSSELVSDNPGSLADSYRSMGIAPAGGAATAMYLWLSRPEALLVAGPVLLLWLISPALAWWISRPLCPREPSLTAEQLRFLRQLARRTWRFFDTFVGPKDHWLPPDNYQEYRLAAPAHRTSPTNMGLALLANLAAYDFGYLTGGQLLERTANTLRTMASLERYRSHFYNWYDTRSRQPLPPLYVSTVDSGNLAGHLLTLRPGLLALADDPVVGARLFDGLSDTYEMLAAALDGAMPAALTQWRQEWEAAKASWPAPLTTSRQRLERLAARAEEAVAQIAHSHTVADSDPHDWARALFKQCQSALDELTVLAPWSLLPAAPDGSSDLPGLDGIPTLRRLARLENDWAHVIEQRLAAAPEEREWLTELRQCSAVASRRAQERLMALDRLVRQAGALARMEYDFLYDPARHLLAIGYNVSERRRDASYYDLLASEARLCSFVAIAQGQLPQESWFSLGRQLTTAAGESLLLSWSGSMFEYLMPLLVMPTYENTLLDRTYKAAVARQIDYGRQCGVPWGVSESGYNTVDANFNYQYRAFGVPGLGMKRGLIEDLVIAPYASVLALMVTPEAACLNLQQLAAEGFIGRFGFFEAIDYTPARQPRGQTRTPVRSFMAHHQGMSLLALAYLLLDRPMQRRFESVPAFQATLLLLQERVPTVSALYTHPDELTDLSVSAGTEQPSMRVFANPDTPLPEVQLLSNGRYYVMVTNAGGGYSRWQDLAVTRWREDGVCDHWGVFCYLRDVTSGEFWSTAYQPTHKRPQHYEAIFSQGRVEFRRRDHDLETHTEIAISPEDDIELRRVHLTNASQTRRTIEVTSYAEVVLAPPTADALHPAFSNLFVQTEIIPDRQAILCTRRPRSRNEQPPWLFHLMVVHGAHSDEVSYETDRLRFIGRNHTIAAPQALRAATRLSGSQGPVLDPMVAIRCRITLDPEQEVIINMVYGVGPTRDVCLGMIEKYRDRRLADRVFDLAWTHSQVVLRQLNATEADAQLYGRLAGSVLYANASLRADPAIISANRRGQSGLWGYAISGDLPIVLLRISDPANIELARQLTQAHAYWRHKGLAVDLVIWNEDQSGYRQLLHDQIMGLIAASVEAHVIDRPGGVFVRSAEQIAPEDRLLLQAVARVVLVDSRGPLAEQISRRRRPPEAPIPHFKATRSHRLESSAPTEPPRQELIFFNGLGGFTPDGREYVIITSPGQATPAPWANVLANPQFGTVISENGVGYTWSENAHEFRLTPWHNDPVTDAAGEAFYLRDEDSGYVWSPTPLPIRGATPYVSRHGFGYSAFEHSEDGIRTETWVYVAVAAPVKFTLLKVRNESGRSRRLSVTGYVEWVLGDLRPKTLMHVVTEIDPVSGAVLAHNSYNTEFPDRVAFFNVDRTERTLSGDRAEFIGRNGSLRQPAAMTRARLSGRTGAGFGPCAAIQTPFELADGQELEIVFTLGVEQNTAASDLAQRVRGLTAAHEALDAVWRYWNRTLGAVQVATPDPAVNVLANGWLVYQTLACRLWGRSGYYQSGGAFGFRDQLQDVMALIYAEPGLAREHLLRCAAHQFVEGDVQHWWHPPLDRGVRTHCSDDYLWLPWVTCHYVRTTGDIGVLDESVHFLEGRPVNPAEEAYYDLPQRSEETAALYQHCVRAILRGLRWGEHGLPLIGSGDWNDGMNLVGQKGKGESVWLGFFLYAVLTQFAELARRRDDLAFANRCRQEATRLRQQLEQQGWDGEWYRRAYFDDGTPLGSASNPECRIDVIAQSWSVLSGAGDGKRVRLAMEAVDQRLVRREQGLIQLLDPPFDQSELNPGYIKGYVPGVRENGGQYTHGAIWATMAFAALGDHGRAWELLSLINPVNHAKTPLDMATYQVEPYVVAADVYARSPHTGRGGWTWYTGSAAWLYRLIVESLLGLKLEVDKLRLMPCVPPAWREITVHYRYRETRYHIVMLPAPPPSSGIQVTVDGVEQSDQAIPLLDDHQEHQVEVRR